MIRIFAGVALAIVVLRILFVKLGIDWRPLFFRSYTYPGPPQAGPPWGYVVAALVGLGVFVVLYWRVGRGDGTKPGRKRRP